MSKPALGIFCGVLLATSLTLQAHAGSTVVKRFGSGGGLNSVGMVDASEDAEISAPQAIYAGSGSELYLLDQVNGRILQFDSKHPSSDVRALELPSTLQPTDLVVNKGSIYVWDGDVHALQASGPSDASVRGLDEVITRGGPDEFAAGAFAQMGSQKPGDDSDLLDENTRSVALKQPRARVRTALQSRGLGAVTVDVIPSDKVSRAEIEVRLRGQTKAVANLRVEVADRLGAVELLDIDRHRRMYALAENIPNSSGTLPAAFVVRYSPEGRAEGVYDLPLSESVALSRRFVTVSEDGDVYFMRTRDGAVDVITLGSRSVRREAAFSTPRHAAPEAPRTTSLVAAVRQLTRQQVIETAFAFEAARWRVNSSAYGPDPDNACTGFRRIRRPGYLIGKLNQEVRGIPYCWGCHGSLNQIRLKIERGVLAGNVCTRNSPRGDATGVDCSAFVSAAWGLANHFTTVAIPTITAPVTNAWDLQPGDALNKPGSHVMLFLRFTPDRKAEVMEASPNACNGRVCRNVYPLSSLLARGYRPVRFRALANETMMAQVMPPAQFNTDQPASEPHHKRHRKHR